MSDVTAVTSPTASIVRKEGPIGKRAGLYIQKYIAHIETFNLYIRRCVCACICSFLNTFTPCTRDGVCTYSRGMYDGTDCKSCAMPVCESKL